MKYNNGRRNDGTARGQVRCCADAELARSGLNPCDLYAEEEGDCSSTLNCAALRARDGAGSWPDQAYNTAAVCGESSHGRRCHFGRK